MCQAHKIGSLNDSRSPLVRLHHEPETFAIKFDSLPMFKSLGSLLREIGNHKGDRADG
jgi:hypothetical protein